MGYSRRLLQALFLSGALCVFVSPFTFASGTWTAGEFAWGDRKTYSGPSPDTPGCSSTLVKIIGATVQSDTAHVCVYDRPSFRYGVYNKRIDAGYLSRYDTYFVVSRSADQNMYVVDNIDSRRLPLEVPGSDDLHFSVLRMGFTNNHLISFIPDFPSKLEMTDPFGELKHYHLADNAEYPFIPYNQSREVITGAVGVSDNGNWMVAEVMGGGLVKIDTKTRKIYGFSNYVHHYGVGSDAHMTFRIANDGSLVAAFDYNISPVIYTTNYMGCGEVTDAYDGVFEAKLREVSCPTDSGRLYEALTQKFSPQQVRATSASGFNSDGDTLYFDQYVYEDENDWMNPTVYRIPLYAGGYIKEDSIEYMALGDSFTSGEGDIEKKPGGSSYYLAGTEDKNECHISSRSYPFLLREQIGIEQSRMKSVACSGARVLPDYIAPIDTYSGQGKRLALLSNEAREQMKAVSLESFMSGNVPQLEFVKKYHPKTITLMGGGNDVGFGDILQYCASPTWEMTVVDDTCGYAIEGNPLRTMLAQSIRSQYDYTLLLLRKIKQASPETTVYIVGYPSFISEEPGVNCFNSAALDNRERTMINEGLTFMNTMLEDAATSMGMQYIDIQDSLEGGRLCEGSEYVTGITNVISQTSERDTHESFHPNAKAHEKIAHRILTNGFQLEALTNSSSLPVPVELETPSYFGEVEQKQTTHLEVVDDTMVEQTDMAVYMPDGSLAPGSEVTLTMFSNAVDLGEVSVDDDGSLMASVDLPSAIKPGRHVLVLDGFAPSGEPARYFQFVTIVSKAENDEDGDGILDGNDSCPFISSWIDKTTQRDICTVTLSETTEEERGDVVGSSNQSHKSQVPDKERQGTEDSTLSVGASEETRNVQITVRDKAERKNALEDDEASTKPAVLGAHTDGVDASRNDQDHDEKLLLGSLVMVSTLVGGYAIVRLMKGKV